MPVNACITVAHKLIEHRIAFGERVQIGRVRTPVHEQRRIGVGTGFVAEFFVEMFVLDHDEDDVADRRERRRCDAGGEKRSLRATCEDQRGNWVRSTMRCCTSPVMRPFHSPAGSGCCPRPRAETIQSCCFLRGFFLPAVARSRYPMAIGYHAVGTRVRTAPLRTSTMATSLKPDSHTKSVAPSVESAMPEGVCPGG